MKPKRKVYLSGYWWFPIRSFEFTTSLSHKEVIERIQSYRKLHIDRKQSTLTTDDTEQTQSFILHSWSRTRQLRIYIKGVVDTIGDVVVIRGHIGIRDRLILGIFFCTHFLLIGGLFLRMLIEVRTLPVLMAVLAFGVFPLGFIGMYTHVLNTREQEFDTFLQTLQAEKAKRGDAL